MFNFLRKAYHRLFHPDQRAFVTGSFSDMEDLLDWRDNQPTNYCAYCGRPSAMEFCSEDCYQSHAEQLYLINKQEEKTKRYPNDDLSYMDMGWFE